MRDIRVAAAQFEHRNDDKAHNLARVRELTRRAVDQGAEIVSFHECCLSGYTFLQHLDRSELAAVAEGIPDGPTGRGLIAVAPEVGAVPPAGLVESAPAGRFYNGYVAVGPDGYL